MIKKHISRNEYYYCGSNVWIRNFKKPNVIPHDINNFIPDKEMSLFLINEIENNKRLLPALNIENFEHKNIVIINNGYNFKEIHKILENIKDITIITVNDVPNSWVAKKKIDYYVVNNPYRECLKFITKNFWGTCIASRRTFPDFLEKYKGMIYTYSPTIDKFYSGIKTENDCYIDDYRNPICASIGVANLFKVKKLLLLCCDEVSEKERSGMISEGKFWCYPQQKVARDLIDGNLYWLKDVKIGIYSALEYKNAEYIQKDGLINFFNT